MPRMIDLTLPIHEGMLTTPVAWHPPVEITILGRHELEGRATRKVTLGTHTGTHMDAPYHFVKDGATIDEIPPETLFNRAVMVAVDRNEEYDQVTIEDIERSGAPIREGCGVVIRTGWFKRWMTPTYYRSWPHLSMEACEYLVDKGISLLGLDVPSPDDPREKIAFGEISPHHYHFLSNGVPLVEFLTNLDQLTQTEFDLIVAPLKVVGADGFPARAIAIEDA